MVYVVKLSESDKWKHKNEVKLYFLTFRKLFLKNSFAHKACRKTNFQRRVLGTSNSVPEISVETNLYREGKEKTTLTYYLGSLFPTKSHVQSLLIEGFIH